MNEDIQDLKNTLRKMTIRLGNPTLQYVIASEGNTSTKTADGKKMVIKASGTTFLNPDFVVVEIKKSLQLLSKEYTSTEVSEKMRDMVINYKGEKPSKEVTFHAALKEYNWIVHTHAREIEGFVCSKAVNDARRRYQYIKKLEEISNGSIAWAPYANPGISLAREVRKAYNIYLEGKGYGPEAIFLQNHGLIVGGDEPNIVEEKTGKYVSAVATLRSELSQKVPIEKMRFGGLKDIDYSDKGVLSRAIIEKLNEFGCENARYCDSQLLNLFVCSKRGREYILTGNITPEQVQCLGVRPAWADYSKSDKLFNNVKAALIDYRRRFDSLPKVIYIEGLGIFAIGRFDEEVGIICDMTDKMVDVLMRTIPFGGPKYLTKEQEKYLAG